MSTLRIAVVSPRGTLTYVDLPGYTLQDFYNSDIKIEVTEHR